MGTIATRTRSADTFLALKLLQPSKLSGPFLNGTKVNTPEALRRRRVIAYIDESGERNSGVNRASDHFTMTAVLVAEEHEHQLQMQIEGAKKVWFIDGALHWVRHLKEKRADRRQILCQMLGAVPGVKVVHVILDKRELIPTTHMATDQRATYNYVAKLLLERIAFAANAWPGGPRVAQVYFGLVGGVHPGYVSQYLNHCACHESGAVPWDAVKWPLKFEATSSRAGLQAADMYSGMLWAALRHGDRRWFDLVHHQIYRSANGRIAGFGIKGYPREAVPSLAHLCERR